MKKVAMILLALLLCVSALGWSRPYSADRELPQLNGTDVSSVDMVAVGDVFTMGEFEQDNDFSNGSEPLEWRVLKKSGKRMLVITEKIIDARPFHETARAIRWRHSDLCAWLNGDFMDRAFTDAERKLIPEVELIDIGNWEYDIGYGAESWAHVFLLDMEEALSYFASPSDRKATATAYANAQGFSSNTSGWWWLRNAGEGQNHAALVNYEGKIYKPGDRISRTNYGVRPVMWIELPMRNGDSSTASVNGSSSPAVSGNRQLPQYQGADVPSVDRVAVGNVITMGEFEQDNDFSNGSEPLEWRVLKKSGKRMLVITEKIIDARPFHETARAIRWRHSDLCAWLNGDFMDKAFTDAERKLIPEVELIDIGNWEYDIGYGAESWAHVFLLDMEEALSYFASPSDRKATATAYANARGFSSNTSGWWWLRNAGEGQNHAALVNYEGKIYKPGDRISRTNYGVRPAMWIELP